MENKTNFIMMIDDDPATNYLHELIVKKSNLFEKYTTYNKGETALEYIKEIPASKNPYPALILLDINMPAINGWEFIEAFEEIVEELNLKTNIVMLTTSINPEDKIKALSYDTVKKFENKPLTVEKLQEIVDEFLSS